MSASLPTLDEEDIAVLQAFSAEKIRWREAMILLGLTSYGQLKALMQQQEFPNPLDQEDEGETVDINALVRHLITPSSEDTP